jgi:hypothetical protein
MALTRSYRRYLRWTLQSLHWPVKACQLFADGFMLFMNGLIKLNKRTDEHRFPLKRLESRDQLENAFTFCKCDDIVK